MNSLNIIMNNYTFHHHTLISGWHLVCMLVKQVADNPLECQNELGQMKWEKIQQMPQIISLEQCGFLQQ